jgi:sialic acid synthase SpsE
MHPKIKIANRTIGTKYKPLIIVELGINHNGKLANAKKLVDEAHKNGAEIIKHQLHMPYYEMSIEAKKIIPPHTKKNIYDIINECKLSLEEELILKKYIESKGMIYLCTPFSREAANYLYDIDIKAFKIGSGECNNYPLIEHICKFKKPMIVSTGMNNINSVSKTVSIMEKYRIQYALLHCTNLYPTPSNLLRLNSIFQLKKKFKNAVIGLSDHSENNFSAYAALGMGCSIIEKHYVTNKKKIKGPDVSSSMNTNDLKELIRASENIFQALPGEKKPVFEEKKIMKFAFSSVVSTKEIKKNEILSLKNIWVKRPGTGDYLASELNKLIGKKTKVKIRANTQIKKKFIK